MTSFHNVYSLFFVFYVKSLRVDRRLMKQLPSTLHDSSCETEIYCLIPQLIVEQLCSHPVRGGEKSPDSLVIRTLWGKPNHNTEHTPAVSPKL